MGAGQGQRLTWRPLPIRTLAWALPSMLLGVVSAPRVPAAPGPGYCSPQPGLEPGVPAKAGSPLWLSTLRCFGGCPLGPAEAEASQALCCPELWVMWSGTGRPGTHLGSACQHACPAGLSMWGVLACPGSKELGVAELLTASPAHSGSA